MRVEAEFGGGRNTTGNGQIICDAQGKPKKYMRIFTKGELANRRQAIFEVDDGDYLLHWKGHYYRGGILTIEQIGGNTIKRECLPELVGARKEFPVLRRALDALYLKVTCYHCRDSHYNAGWEPSIREPDHGEIKFLKEEVLEALPWDIRYVGEAKSNLAGILPWSMTSGDLPKEVLMQLSERFPAPKKPDDESEYRRGRAKVFSYKEGYIVTVLRRPRWVRD